MRNRKCFSRKDRRFQIESKIRSEISSKINIFPSGFKLVYKMAALSFIFGGLGERMIDELLNCLQISV